MIHQDSTLALTHGPRDDAKARAIARIWAGIAMGVGIAVLALQLALTVSARMSTGYSFAEALVVYFSFFSVQVNIILVLVYAAHLFRPAWLSVFAQPVTRAMAAAAITMVMVFYYLFLSPIWVPDRLWLVAGMTLHYIAPLAYLGWFALFKRSGTLNYRAIGHMLIYPAGYLAYTVVRGAIFTEYPYRQLEASYIGYGQFALNSLGLFVSLIALMALAVAIDRLQTHRGEVS